MEGGANPTVVSIIVGYLVVATLFALWMGRKVKSSSEFLVAGGRMGFLLVAMTLVGGWEGTGASIGVSQAAYGQGIYAGFYSSFFAAGLILTVFTLLKLIRRTLVLTPAELLGRMFGVETRVLTAVLLLFQNSIVLAMQLVGGAGVIGAVLGIPYGWGLFAIVATMGLYTLVGGIVAVAWANVLHALLQNLVAWAAVPIVIAWIGGWDRLVTDLPPHFFSVEGIGLSNLAGWWWTLSFGVIVVGFQQVQQAASSREAEKGFWLAAILVSVYSMPFALLGVSAAATFPGVSPLMAMPMLAMRIDPIFAGLLLASVIAAVLANPGITLQPLYFVNDVWRVYRPQADDRECLMVARFSLLVTIALVVGVAATIQQIVAGLIFAFTFRSVILLAILAGLLLKGRRLIKREGALAGIFCGACSIFVFQWAFPTQPPLYGTLAVVITSSVVVSAMTRRSGRFRRSASENMSPRVPQDRDAEVVQRADVA